MFNVIPAIDILGGRVVRLKQGRYDKVEFFDESPEEFAHYFEAAGAKRIHVVDLDGAKDGKPVNADVFKRLRNATSCEIELGGGIRNRDTAQYFFDLGINYLILGSLLVKDPNLSKDLIETFPKKIIAGVDTHNNKVASEGWLESGGLDANTLIDTLNTLPLHAIIYTDIAKDGMMQGPNINALKNVASVSQHPIIASGGVRNLEDINVLKDLENTGITGCIIGKAVLSKQLDLNTVYQG